MHQWNGRLGGLINRAVDWLFAQLNESWSIDLRRRQGPVTIKNSGR